MKSFKFLHLLNAKFLRSISIHTCYRNLNMAIIYDNAKTIIIGATSINTKLFVFNQISHHFLRAKNSITSIYKMGSSASERNIQLNIVFK